METIIAQRSNPSSQMYMRSMASREKYQKFQHYFLVRKQSGTAERVQELIVMPKNSSEGYFSRQNIRKHEKMSKVEQKLDDRARASHISRRREEHMHDSAHASWQGIGNSTHSHETRICRGRLWCKAILFVSARDLQIGHFATEEPISPFPDEKAAEFEAVTRYVMTCLGYKKKTPTSIM